MLLPPPLSLPAVRSRPSLTRRGWVAAAMVWLICVGSTARGQAQVACLQPVAGLQVDESAAEFLRENRVSGRLVVWFNWGEYVSWHFGRELTISMDGRRETVYSKQLLDAHNDFYGGGAGARAFLERLAPDYIWLPTTLPVSSQLDAWGWKAVYQTNVSTIWARTPVPAARPARSWRPPNRSLSSCFPFASASTSPAQKS
jgi:hypothetical protein